MRPDSPARTMARSLPASSSSSSTSPNVRRRPMPPFRGVGAAALAVRGDIKIIEGRKFESGRSEIIVGTGAARSFEGLDVGHKLRVGQNVWDVVGIFSGGGGAAESELWTDAAVLQAAYKRGESFQSVCA